MRVKAELGETSNRSGNRLECSRGGRTTLGRLALRLVSSLAGVAIVTFAARSLIPNNPATVGFAYLLLVLIIASTWGFIEALLASIGGTLAFNFFFLPPTSTFTIADPQSTGTGPFSTRHLNDK